MNQEQIMKIIQSNPQTTQMYQQLQNSQNPMQDLQVMINQSNNPQMQQAFQKGNEMLQGKDQTAQFNTIGNFAQNMGFKF